MADAYTRIADTIVPEVYARYQFEESVEKMDIFQAGVIYSDPDIVSKLSDGGYVVDMPMWQPLPRISSEPVNDDPTDIIEVKKVTSRKERAARNIRAQAWGIADVTKILAGDDPQRIVVQDQADYWQWANKYALLQMLKGIIADNVANDSGDLVYDTNATIGDLDLIDAAYLMGDRAGDFKTVWMHSKQAQKLRRLNQIDFVPPSEQGGPVIEYWNGLRLIVDDELPVATNEYTAFIFKNQAVHWAELPVTLNGGPLEFDRKPRAGHGAGVTEIIGRRHFVPHVKGFTFIGTPAGDFATDTELAAATSWDRATTIKKHVPFIALKTTET